MFGSGVAESAHLAGADGRILVGLPVGRIARDALVDEDEGSLGHVGDTVAVRFSDNRAGMRTAD